MWALKIQIPDTEVKRRRWIIHIALHYENSHVAKLNYAEFYQDFTLGCFVSLTQPHKKTPDFIRNFVRIKTFHCVVGNYRLPIEAVMLDDNGLSSFLGMINDSGRSIPIVLVTCPSSMDSVALADILLTNGAVFVTAERALVEIINSHLPETIRVSMGTVHVFPVGNAYVQVLHRDKIIQMSNPVLQMRYAYCECMHSDERHGFLTYDELILLRNPNRLSETPSRIKIFSKENIEVSPHCEMPTQNSAFTNQDEWKEAGLCKQDGSRREEEHSTIEAQIEEITMALYDGKPPGLSCLPQSAAIGHLLEALKFVTGPAPP